MNKQRAVIIAGISGRALAASARKGGFIPLVVDFFGDEDTRALAHAHVRLTSHLTRGIDAEELFRALDALAAFITPAGVVYGSGFEDRPALIARMGERWRILGNAAETVLWVKDPARFAALCHDCAIPHPPTTMKRPADPTGWLVKRWGGAGGTHIRLAVRDPKDDELVYYQRRVGGTPVSALVLGNGRAAIVLGLSAQWSSPTKDRPFRYGGAVRPAMIGSKPATELADAAKRLACALGLVGLNSVDFVVEGGDFWLLEVNPRPGATIDIFEPSTGSLFGLHVEACAGALPAKPPQLRGAMAAAIVYADRDIISLPAVDWPEWTADRQRAATALKAGQPVCTVHSRASTSGEAKDLVECRIAAIRAQIETRIDAKGCVAC